MWTFDYLFINPEKIDSPDIPNSRTNMDYNFMIKIKAMIEIMGYQFKINSGYRSTEHNKKVGGVLDSAHTKGLALDIATSGGLSRYGLVKVAMDVGILRIGVNSEKEFIHLDYDSSKPTSVWSY